MGCLTYITKCGLFHVDVSMKKPLEGMDKVLWTQSAFFLPSQALACPPGSFLAPAIAEYWTML